MNLSFFRLSCLVITLSITAIAYQSAGCADDLPNALIIGTANDAGLVPALSSSLKSAGYSVSTINAGDIKTGDLLSADKIDLMVLSDAASLPVDTIDPISAYMQNGGNVIALNAPLWGDAVMKAGDRYTTVEEYLHTGVRIPPRHVVVNFSPESIADWGRGTNKPDNPVSIIPVPNDLAPGVNSLHVNIKDLDGWDTFGSQDIYNPFPDGNTLTVFAAKGGPETSQAYLEWVEKDGSRWVAVVPLYQEWRLNVLSPDDFHFWQSNPARGFKGDKFNPANAQRLSIGLSFSFTGWTPGDHEYWMGPIGTAGMNEEYRQIIASRKFVVADTLSPAYKFFNSANAAGIRIRKNQSIVTPEKLPLPARIKSSHPRPSGAGFNKGRAWRWISLAEADTKDEKWCGNPATLLINADGSYKGGVWASFGIDDPAWYKTPQVTKMIQQIAERLKNPVFLLDGGTSFYTYFEDQNIELGARVANLGDLPSDMHVRLSLTNAKTGKTVVSYDMPINALPGSIQTVSRSWKPDNKPSNGFIARVELILNGKVIDSLTHETTIYQPKKKNNFVKIGDGEFILNGKQWRPNGVNYMPTSGMAIEDGEIFGTWLCAKAYDPEVIERDIRNMQSMGINAVSIFLFHQDMKAQNLLDMLRRLDNHGMKANLSLRPGTPMDFPWNLVKEMIEYYRLKDNDTVFAYDLAWEPMFGSQGDRKQWDSEWVKWIIERYGSVENAEKDWSYPVPRNSDGSITNPNSGEIGTDGEWRRMVAAYRRFLDTLLYKKYGRAADLVHSIDPNHFVSFRMAEASNPEYSWGENIPYEFPYLATAVDFLSPEAYGRVGNWERVKPGWYQREYARLYAPDKPMIWAEMGVSTWDNGRMTQSPGLLDFQGQYFENIYRMMIRSGANGLFSWFYPGGYRYDEKSDYGILNPDGSERPVSRTIKKMGPEFINAPAPSGSEYMLEIDRDARATGLAGAYAMTGAKFWAAIDKGLTPRLRTAGTGTTSANCPLIAVGNTPCNGTNPPKYLDGMFDKVEIMGIDGEWTDVEKGAQINVRRGKPVKARITLTNPGEASWLAGQGAGKVMIRAEYKQSHYLPLMKDVAHNETIIIKNAVLMPSISEQTDLILSLDASGRTPFGEKFLVKLDPQ